MFFLDFLDILDFCEFPVEHVGLRVTTGLGFWGQIENVTGLINPKKLVPAHHKIVFALLDRE